MKHDYRELTDDELELVEKQTLRTIVQALQQYSAEARFTFERTVAPSDQEVIVIAEDVVQYALEVAECYPIDRRFAGFIDYKRLRWLSTPFSLLPQVLLVDAKASTESNRETLQASQLSMDATFESNGRVYEMPAGVPPHMVIPMTGGRPTPAVTTSLFVHFHYRKLEQESDGRVRELRDIFVLALPHQRLKWKYNPDAATTFYGQGKHSPARGEVPRIRVYFSRLSDMCHWRLQRLTYTGESPYSIPLWRDTDENGEPTEETFSFIGRGASVESPELPTTYSEMPSGT